MGQNNNPTLGSIRLSARVLATCYIICFLIGYFVAIVQVFDRSHFDMDHVAKYYRGDELGDDQSIMLPQSFSTILSVTHTHSFSQPVLFALLGFIYLFSRASEKNKITLYVLLFSGTVLSNAAAWLIRYVCADFTYLYPISQTMIFIPILIMSFTSIREMWFQPNK